MVAIAASPPPDLADLIGARGSSIDNAMGTRGYRVVQSDGKSFYWNASSGSCVDVGVHEGRVHRITQKEPHACGMGSHGNRASAGGSAGKDDFCAPTNISEANRAECEARARGATSAASGGSGRQRAIETCRETFSGTRQGGQLGTVTALRPGYWEVILSDNYGRKVGCTARETGTIEDWVELGKK